MDFFILLMLVGCAWGGVRGYSALVSGIPVERARDELVRFGIEHEAELGGAGLLEYVSVAYDRERVEHQRPIEQSGSIFFADGTGRLVPQFPASIWKYHSVGIRSVLSDFLLNIGDHRARKNLPAATLDYVNRESLAGVYEDGRKFHILCDGINFHFRNAEPCSLVNDEIIADVAPLKQSYNRVDYASKDSDYFQDVHPAYRFPPRHGCILGLFGICGIAWGWMTGDRRIPWSGCAFIVGIVLRAWALLILLPWRVC
ncbi:MAG: hypothetical protein ABSB88_14595 [Bryobacteraceae bacterium]